MFINFSWLKIFTLSIVLSFLPAWLFGSSTSVNKSEFKNSDAPQQAQTNQEEWDWEEFCNMGAEWCCQGEIQTQATTGPSSSPSSPENSVTSNQGSPKKLSKHERAALFGILNSLEEAAQEEKEADERIADTQASAALEAACKDWKAIGKSHLGNDPLITVCMICSGN